VSATADRFSPPQADMTPALSVRDLVVDFPTRRGTLTAVNGVSFDIAPGEVLGVVGESGAGKSLTGAAIIGLLEPPGRIAGGQVILHGERIDDLAAEPMRRIRGKRIGMVFQDPLTSLNPLYRVGRQIVETIQTHRDVSDDDARTRAIELLTEVGIQGAEQRIDSYPHEFSGGMRQRVVLALALAAEPELIIADEPTTALDVSIQAQIIALLKRLCRAHGTSVMLITHDMGVIAETADRVAVMYAGRIAEIGPVQDVIHAPSHPYTQGLMGAIPSVEGTDTRLTQIPGSMPRLTAIPSGCAFHERCLHAFDRCRAMRPDLEPAGRSFAACWLVEEPARRLGGAALAEATEARSVSVSARKPEDRDHNAVPATGPSSDAALVNVAGLSRTFDVSKPWLNRVIEGEPRRVLKAVQDVSLSIAPQETFALVGESGSGKSTVAKMLVGLLEPTHGDVTVHGIAMWPQPPRADLKRLRRRIQMIFQDPYASLNPRWRVARIVSDPIRAFGLASSEDEIAERVGDLLRTVGLDPADGEKFPHEFSGGQRQRICVARALSSNPEFLVCDEPTSALDVSVQAQILNLMRDLQDDFGLTYLFISHNLAVVRHMATRIGVMYLGRIVEIAPSEALFANPQHPYTRMLLDAVPDLKMTGRARRSIEGEIPNPIAPPSGCAFHPRCPLANERCRNEVPRRIVAGAGEAACHAVEEGRA